MLYITLFSLIFPPVMPPPCLRFLLLLLFLHAPNRTAKGLSPANSSLANILSNPDSHLSAAAVSGK